MPNSFSTQSESLDATVRRAAEQLYFLPDFDELPLEEKLELLSASEIEAALQAPFTLDIDILGISKGTAIKQNLAYVYEVLSARNKTLRAQGTLVFEELYRMFTNESVQEGGGELRSLTTRREKYDFYLQPALWRRARRRLWKRGDEASLRLQEYWDTHSIPDPQHPLALNGVVFPDAFAQQCKRDVPSHKPAFMVHRLKAWSDRPEKAARYQLTRRKEYELEYGVMNLDADLEVRRGLFATSIITDMVAGSFIYLGRHAHGKADSIQDARTKIATNAFFQTFFGVGEIQNSYSNHSSIPRYQITLHPTEKIHPKALAYGIQKMDTSPIEVVISDAESLICGHLFGANSDPLYKQRRVRTKRTFRGNVVKFTDDEEVFLEYLRTSR